jgi:hypothetical protein
VITAGFVVCYLALIVVTFNWLRHRLEGHIPTEDRDTLVCLASLIASVAFPVFWLVMFQAWLTGVYPQERTSSASSSPSSQSRPSG